MTSRDFCFWLQSAFELMEAKTFSEKQTEMIRRHLSLVFAHDIDPSMGPQEQQEKLNKIHLGDDDEIKKLKDELDKLKTRPPFSKEPLIRC